MTLTELRAIAEAAHENHPHYWPHGPGDDMGPAGGPWAPPCSAYVEAMKPEVVKALIAAAEAAEKDIPTPRVRRALDALKAALA